MKKNVNILSYFDKNKLTKYIDTKTVDTDDLLVNKLIIYS